MDNLPEQPNHQPLWNRISSNALVRFLLFFASGWAFVAVLQYFEYVIFVFMISAIAALLLNYPLRYLSRFVGRKVALAIVITLSLIAIMVLVLGVGLTLVNQIQQLISLLLQTLNTSNNPLEQLQSALVARNISLNLDAIQVQIRNAFVVALNWAFNSLPVLIQNYVTFIIVLVVTFFMLIDGASSGDWC